MNERGGPSVLAIVCTRNESVHVTRCVRDLIDEGIDVVLIDNESTDDTVAKARPFLGKGLRAIETMPWRGVFSLSEQLRRKAAIAAAAPHDWIMHADADEGFEAPPGLGAMRAALETVQTAGYNCVNFRQFVFVPLHDENFTFDGYADVMRTYYFFEPRRPHFMRAWRRELAAHLPEHGGHVLQGPGVRLFPDDFAMRHYITLSERHAIEKYCERRFSDDDLAKGWHGNRLAIGSTAFRLEPRPELRTLAAPRSRAYDASAPQRTHYWEWPAL
ncbi:MAG TPA: glycosyltransferase [Candidatus Elarobacter sp.]